MGSRNIKEKLAWLAGRTEFRVAAAYLLFGALWIELSDKLLFAVVYSQALQQKIAIYKGWAFVASSAALFYFLLRAEVRRVAAAETALRALNEALEAKVRERTALLDAGNAELEDLYNNAPCGYHSLNAEGVFVKINNTELRWLGYAREQVVGKLKFQDVLSEAGREVFRKSFPVFKAAGEIKDLEFEFRRADGTFFFGLLNAASVLGPDGGFRHSRSVVFDITEKKRTRDELARYAARLEDANKELEAFSYSVSHDLRAPLRAIEGFTRILQEDYAGRLDAEAGRLIGVIHGNTQKLGRLIEDLLAFARVAGRELSPATVDMEELAREAWKEAAPEGWAGRLEIGRLPPAAGDRALLKQVWVNLFSNAVKFTGKTRSPRVKAAAAEGRPTEYSVSDNGAGFDPASADKLFRIFQRLHPEAEFPGTGVGLAIVNRIIRRHGGAVRAEGRPGEGAAFFFTLPAPRG